MKKRQRRQRQQQQKHRPNKIYNLMMYESTENQKMILSQIVEMYAPVVE